jgi:hypothetical protein
VTRNTMLRAALLALPLTAALLYIALNWYRIEPETVWVRAGEEARRNPFLAYTRLLERMGAAPRVLGSPSRLASLPDASTLVMAGNRLAYMTPQRVREITAWVQRGGTLVVQSEAYGIDDPLLDAFGVEREFPEWMRKRGMPPRPPELPGGGVVRLPWPGEEQPLRVSFPGVLPDLRDLRVRSDVVAAKLGSNTVLLSFASGRGRVTIVPRLAFLANDSIGKLDHARAGWRLAAAERPGRVVALFTKLETPPFIDWVRQHAWAVAIAAALLVFAWLARIVPRFGPLAPEAPPVRRSLREHIVASGRYLWSRGEHAYLIEALRERVWRAARRRGIDAPTTSRRAKAIEAMARLASVPAADAERALFGHAAVSAAFTGAAARLQDIESGLAFRARRTPPRKARP